MKCKIFTGTNINELEFEINKWLEENKSRVVDTFQSESEACITITFLYMVEEK